MITQLRAKFSQHRVAACLGILFGFAAALAWTTWFVNFAPFDEETSSAWSAPGEQAPQQRTATRFYQPRVDDLLARVRVHGRFGGSAWQSLREAADAWMLADPIACLNHLTALGAAGLVENATLDDAITRATGGNFAVALQLTDQLTDPLLRREWLTRAFELQAKESPEEAFAALRAVPRYVAMELEDSLTQKWARTDPRRGIAAFAAEKPEMAYLILSRWAERDLEGAVRFLKEKPDGFVTADGRTFGGPTTLRNILRGAASLQPEKAFALMAASPDPGSWSTQMESALRRLAATDPARALQLAHSLQTETQRLRARAAIAGSASLKHPELAEQIRSSIPGERARSSSACVAIRTLAEDEPAAAAKLASAFTDPIIRSDAMHVAAASWLQKEPVEVVEFAVRELKSSGNPLWLRTVVDELLDARSVKEVLDSDVVQKLGRDSRAEIMRELAARPDDLAKERLIDALQ